MAYAEFMAYPTITLRRRTLKGWLMNDGTTSTANTAGDLISDVFMHLYEQDEDEKWILAAENCALSFVFGKVTAETLPDYIAGIVAGLKED